MDNDDFMEVTVVEEKKPEPSERRKKLVSELSSRIKSAKSFHEKPFKQMAKDMDAALKGYDDTEWNDTSWKGTDGSKRFNQLVKEALEK